MCCDILKQKTELRAPAYMFCFIALQTRYNRGEGEDPGLSKINQAQREVEDVKGIMTKNIGMHAGNVSISVLMLKIHWNLSALNKKFLKKTFGQKCMEIFSYFERMEMMSVLGT